ncbi:MAG: site-specific integrase [Bacteroidales bacterium]|nr:site-specific integrase [Bacteroidales bacterium]
MPKKKNKNTEILDFIPAQIYNTKSSFYIGYYVKNPVTSLLERKRIKINRIKNKGDRLKYARQLVLKINRKLESGWNPFIEQEAPKSFTLLKDAIETFLIIKTKELKPDSLRSYKSILKMFFEFLQKEKKGIYVINVSVHEAKKYLNYLYLDKDVSERTHNSHRSMLKTFWFWLIENGYSNSNIFEGIKKKKEKTKSRIFIEPEIRTKIFEFLEQQKEYHFLIICYLTFYGLIRPKEILLLKPADIMPKQSIVKIRAENSKTGKERLITIPDKVFKLFEKIKLDKINRNWFIFGKNFKPSTKFINSRDIGRRWSYIRRDLKLTSNIQFYGLKDSGIVEMLRAGISPESVRDQAGHSSLDMTNKYIQIARLSADEQILSKINY